MKTLNVKKVTLKELLANGWPMPLVSGFYEPNSLSQIFYIRCNTKGEINWEKAPIYTLTELIERNNVKIIKP